jgi:hypothetical protein
MGWYVLGDSKTRPRLSASSAAFRVTISLSLAHFRILVRDVSWVSVVLEAYEHSPTYIDTKGHVSITSIRLELLSEQFERDKRDVRVVHCLEGLFISYVQGAWA